MAADPITIDVELDTPELRRVVDIMTWRRQVMVSLLPAVFAEAYDSESLFHRKFVTGKAMSTEVYREAIVTEVLELSDQLAKRELQRGYDEIYAVIEKGLPGHAR